MIDNIFYRYSLKKVVIICMKYKHNRNQNQKLYSINLILKYSIC